MVTATVTHCFIVISGYSSTCHERPPPVQSESGLSWQVAPRDKERRLLQHMSNIQAQHSIIIIY